MQDANSNAISNYGSVSPIAASSGNSTGSSYYGNSSRIYGRSILSGNIRGNQNITGAVTITNPNTNKQNISIDGSTQAITITNTDGSIVGMGLLPDGSGDFGFYAQDASGNLLYKIVGSTIYGYDVTTKTNVIQLLKLPDNTYGWAVAAPGKNVADGIA